MTFGEQIRRGAGPYHLDCDTPVLKIDGNGGSPAPGVWLAAEGITFVGDLVVLLTETGSVIQT